MREGEGGEEERKDMHKYHWEQGPESTKTDFKIDSTKFWECYRLLLLSTKQNDLQIENSSFDLLRYKMPNLDFASGPFGAFELEPAFKENPV